MTTEQETAIRECVARIVKGEAALRQQADRHTSVPASAFNAGTNPLAGQAEPVALTDRQLHIAACKIYAAASADSTTMLAVIRSLGFKDGQHFEVVP